MLGAIAKGKTRVRGVLDCDDCNYTIRAFKELGVSIRKDGESTVIDGVGLRGLKAPAGPIRVGNSGTSMRLLAGILAGQHFETVLEGDEGLSRRPMKRITEPLALMGVDIRPARDGHPPLKITGGAVKSINYKLPVPSAQVKSALLFAGLYADGTTVVEEKYRSRDHTERMLKHFGAKVDVKGLAVSVKGGKELVGRSFDIPGDISSASFFLAGAALIKGSKVKVTKVNINPTRAGIIDILADFGAKVKVTNRADTFEPYGDIEVQPGVMKGIVIKESAIPGIIDELPIIFVLAALAEGATVIRGAGELRVKETDRINSMKENLEAMGASVKVGRDEITIEGVRQLKGAKLRSFGDHRTCMAMTIAALTAKGSSAIDDVRCINKSFPEFFKLLEKLSLSGARAC